MDRETGMKALYTVTHEMTDEFGNGQAPGWAIRWGGERVDWPLSATQAEALADVPGFRRADRELAAEARSERMIGA